MAAGAVVRVDFAGFAGGLLRDGGSGNEQQGAEKEQERSACKGHGRHGAQTCVASKPPLSYPGVSQYRRAPDSGECNLVIDP
jgi:hypothetical protein